MFSTLRRRTQTEVKMDNNSEAKKKDETLDAAAETDKKEATEEKVMAMAIQS